jgi:uncharacterized YccA/Bax inhibitor family protein
MRDHEHTRGDAVADTLRRMETMEQRSRISFIAAFVLEGLFLGAVLLLADFKDRTHVLLLLSVSALLTLGALWGVALVGVVNRHTLRVLRALEMLDIRPHERP